MSIQAVARAAVSLLVLATAACEETAPVVPPSSQAATTAKSLVTSSPLDSTPAPLKLPQMRVGDHWEYSDGYKLSVSEVQPDGLARFQMEDGSDSRMLRRAFFVDASFTGGVTRTVVFRTSNPMKIFEVPAGTPVGDVRETMRGTETLRAQESWVVEGHETITVPAGTFDCWVVVGRIKSLQSTYQAYERWWYSPQVRNYVRLEFKSGDNTEGSRVLLSYKLN
ncbi:MAG: hypothetical protein HQL37_05280 [Alphaproteobacteria bacterium]|nr:hypothetical protein [Alphaproteobacteria bacterium]